MFDPLEPICISLLAEHFPFPHPEKKLWLIFGILILVNFTNLSPFNTDINDKGYIFNPNQRFSKARGE